MGCDNEAVLRRGLGSLSEVAKALGNLPDEQHHLRGRIEEAATSLLRLREAKGGEYCVGPLFCGLFNEWFAETGRMWRVDDEDKPQFTYHPHGEERDAIAMLLGAPQCAKISE